MRTLHADLRYCRCTSVYTVTTSTLGNEQPQEGHDTHHGYNATRSSVPYQKPGNIRYLQRLEGADAEARGQQTSEEGQESRSNLSEARNETQGEAQQSPR